jgi:hypothetical protein
MLTSLINTPPKPIVDHYKKHPTPMLTIEFYKKNIHQCSLVSSTWEECTHGHSCSHITITHVFLPTPNVCGLSESFHLPLRTSSGQHARLVGQLHPYQSVVPPLHPTPHKPISLLLTHNYKAWVSSYSKCFWTKYWKFALSFEDIIGLVGSFSGLTSSLSKLDPAIAPYTT